MVHYSSESISTTKSQEELFDFFSQPEKVISLFDYKKVRHLKFKEGKIDFILKRVANFKFEPTDSQPKAYVQYESKKGVNFTTAIRFDFSSPESLQIHFESDTTDIMDFMLKRRAGLLVDALLENFSKTV